MKNNFKKILSLMFFLLLAVAGRSDPPNVFWFKPEDINPKWSVFLATIAKIAPQTKPEELYQKGLVTLNVAKILYGKQEQQITLPYSYVQYALWKAKNRNKGRPLPGGTEDTIWPELTDLKKPYLLVIVNPEAVDPSIHSGIEPEKLATWVKEVDDENDAEVKVILTKIPHKE